MPHPNVDAVVAMSPVTAALDRLGVPYHVCGSLASSAHGLARSTVDADLVADLRDSHVRPLVAALGDQYYASEPAIRDAIRFRTSFNLIYLPLSYKVDLFIPKLRPWTQASVARVRPKRLDPNDPSTEFPFASPEDTILSKLEWFRAGGETSERQWLDVLNILKVQRARLDDPYLDHWAAQINVADLLHRARSEV